MAETKKETITDKAKSLVKNRLWPGFKGGLVQNALSNGGAVAGTLYSLKKGKSLPKAMATGGLVGMAAGDIAGSAIVPAARLKKLHNKELGTNPTAKDYAKVLAVNTLPTAAMWGIIAKNKKPLQKGLENAGTHIGAVMSAAKKGNVDKKGIVGAGKAMAGIGAGMGIADKIMEVPTYMVTPETIVNKKKEKVNNMEKSAFEILDEAFDKIAEEKEKRNYGKELRENKTKFWKDRAGSALLDGLVGGTVGSLAGSVVGRGNPNAAKLGGMAGMAGMSAYRLNKKHKEEFGTAPTTDDYAKNVASKVIPVPFLAMANTPEAIIKHKKRQQIMEDRDNEKSAFEVLDEAFDKIASMYEEE